MREMETLEERLWLYEQVQPMLHKQAPHLFSLLASGPEGYMVENFDLELCYKPQSWRRIRTEGKCATTRIKK